MEAFETVLLTFFALLGKHISQKVIAICCNPAKFIVILTFPVHSLDCHGGPGGPNATIIGCNAKTHMCYSEKRDTEPMGGQGETEMVSFIYLAQNRWFFVGYALILGCGVSNETGCRKGSKKYSKVCYCDEDFCNASTGQRQLPMSTIGSLAMSTTIMFSILTNFVEWTHYQLPPALSNTVSTWISIFQIEIKSTIVFSQIWSDYNWRVCFSIVSNGFFFVLF